MDAHVFRFISRILAARLHKARLERIYEPIPDVTTFSFFASGKKHCLILRAHRSSPLLFLTARSPLPNPPAPPARVMRLRKFAVGRTLGEARVDWPNRQIAFALPDDKDKKAAWLLLDCKQGASITQKLPENFDSEPPWPSPAESSKACVDTTAEAAWRRFQVFTPALRRTLRLLDAQDAAALLVDLEGGQGDLFWYGGDAAPSLVSAWPLPFELTQPAAPTNRPVWEKATPATEEDVALSLLESLQFPTLLQAAKVFADTPGQKMDKAAAKKKKRLALNLEEEKKRLESMLLLGDDARVIQNNLWRFSPDERREIVTLPVDQACPTGELRTIALNPHTPIVENMQIMFRKATRAARGMIMLEKRMNLLQEAPKPSLKPSASPLQSRKQKQLHSPSLIQEFLSSDGFILWRGRSAEGNRALLKSARPFDLWFHVEDGPSAHLLLRRDHAAHEVPERSLHEAAVLTGLKSWRKYDPKASVMVALARHVQAVKGGAPGTVRVQEVARTVFVSLDEALEERLKRRSQTPT